MAEPKSQMSREMKIQKFRFRAMVGLTIFVAATAGLFVQQRLVHNREREIREVTAILTATIEDNIIKNHGKNFELSELTPLEFGKEKAIFRANYAFDHSIENGSDFTTSRVQTEIVIDRKENTWHFTKLQGFKQNIEYLEGFLVNAKQ